MIGPTKAEAIADLIEVVNFDPTEALAPVNVMCPDCKGKAGLGYDADDEGAPYCATCQNGGFITLVGWDMAKMSLSFRRNIQDIKHDVKGRLILSFRNKDKAATELKTMLGWDRPDTLNRDASGRTLSVDEIAQRQADTLASVEQLTKERIIADLLALADDALTGATERVNILKTVAQLKGFIAATGDTLPDLPAFEDFYSGDYKPTIREQEANGPAT